MTHSPFRLLRTTVVGATVFGLAAGAHIVAGGALPGPAVLAAILALHILCSTVATKFRLTPLAMIALLASSQIVLHQGFETLSHSFKPGTAAGSGSAESHAMSHHGMSAQEHAAAMMPQAPPLSPQGLEQIGHAGDMSGWMLAAHVGATLAAALILAYGETVLWSLANWLRPLYRRADVVLDLPVQTARPTIVPRMLPRLPWRNVPPDTQRGPPASVALFASHPSSSLRGGHLL
ncbi:hypothetical protein [Arthrobacter antibioticus]|uniref:hypothetical protein n=1 Tax=Arthrobacter sp. H35-MC1 TaxID=3046203 RepID=UPI0024B8F2B0|nr:hypothetical protein [Arthrobacter sp. H35-MC1]MDJ0317971.1 hypothetical protein [Arthrobacter sp. H35-MC1]